MDLPKGNSEGIRSYKCPELPEERGWDWARSQARVYSDAYDEHCFAPRTRWSPSTYRSGICREAVDVVSKKEPGQYNSKCPVHDDVQSSLRILVLPTGKILFHCHAGCSTEEVLEAMSLKWSDINGRGSKISELGDWRSPHG